MANSLPIGKKDRTRRTLLEVADALFDASGYEATTLEDICRAASVSMRTFFRYFDSKPDLALYENHRNVGRLRDLLAEPEAGDLLDRVQHLYTTLALELEADPQAQRRVRRMLREPALIAHSMMIDLDSETRLAAAFARRWRDPKSLQAQLLAALIVGGARAALRGGIASRGEPRLVDRLTEAFRFIRESRLACEPGETSEGALNPIFVKKTN